MSNESQPRRRGLLLVISSPSGAGKTSLARRLIVDNPSLTLSISATTRPPRPGERDGREYRFMDAEAFEAMAMRDAFMESAEVHEHRYGTPRAEVQDAIDTGRDVLFDIDWQGAKSIAAAAPNDVVRVFILPPSMADLASRLHSRAQDSEDVIARRLGRAKGEIEKWMEYDYIILNDDFERAYADLAAIYRTERLRRQRNQWIGTFVERLIG